MTTTTNPPGLDDAMGGTPEDPSHRRSRLGLAAMMIGAGVLHFVAPKQFDTIIPEVLGGPRFWTLSSGVVEIVCGSLLLSRTTEKAGGMVAAATIVVVYPANIKAALDQGAPTNPVAAFTWLRLPMQYPLFRWALRHAQG